MAALLGGAVLLSDWLAENPNGWLETLARMAGPNGWREALAALAKHEYRVSLTSRPRDFSIYDLL